MQPPDRSLAVLTGKQQGMLEEQPEPAVSRATALVLVIVFLCLLATGQALQWTGGVLLGDDLADAEPASPWSLAGEIAQDVRTAAAEWTDEWNTVRRIVAVNRIVLGKLREVDDTLDHESVVGRLLRPSAQYVLSRWLGAGNEQAYCGRDGWLFYRQDVEYVTGPGFLEAGWLERRREASDEWVSPPQPDPRPAIESFARALAARGIVLIVVPTPVKPSVHPEKLRAAYEDGPAPINNPSYEEVKQAFEAAGALVFEPLDALARNEGPAGEALYLATDTHWRPESMERVARELAEFVRRHVPMPPVPDPDYTIERIEITGTGDLRVMLDLPGGASVFPAETVSIGRVTGPGGSPWRPSRSADVLLLGDSFANIYSLGSMGWGENAGLAEHLSAALGRPVDRIVQNSDGAYATRAMLWQQAGGASDRLAGKRVVIYQFAARELAFGDWKILEP